MDHNDDQEEIYTNVPPNNYETPVEGRVRRNRREPIWMIDYKKGEGLIDDVDLNVMVVTGDDPISFEKAIESQKWKDAMMKEMESIEKSQTWELTNLPIGMKPIGVKWIFKTKFKENGEIDKFKARLVTKGCAQQYGLDYTEVFASIVRLDIIRIILAIATQYGWIVFHLDVKNAFLHGELKEDIYVQQPTGFVKKEEEDKVYKLKKALYGLKQAPRTWYNKIEAYFVCNGFDKCLYEHTLFTKSNEGGKILIVSLYVNDLIYTRNDWSMCDEFRRSMMSEFDMTDLGRMRYFLEVEIMQSSNGIFVCQRKYTHEVLSQFFMENCNAVKNPIVPGTRL